MIDRDVGHSGCVTLLLFLCKIWNLQFAINTCNNYLRLLEFNFKSAAYAFV